MKKQAIFITVLSAMLLASCNVATKPVESSQSAVESGDPEVSSSISPASSIPESVNMDKDNQPENDIHSEPQWQYLCDEWGSIKTYVPKTNASGKNPGNLSSPRGLILPFDDVEDGDTYYIEISKEANFEHSKIVTSTEKSYAYKSAEIGVKYYYRAATSEEGLASAAIKDKTSALIAPRNIEVGGVVNFRDIGGWKTSLVENGYIKQGLYYRCGEFNKTNAANAKNITAEGKALVKELGIKVDIDMRDSYNVDRLNGKSPASSEGWDITVVKASIPSGTESTRFSGFADVYKNIFDKIAMADEAPIALHCANGADRTGIVCYFLLALLGASEEDCGRDYSFTRFAGERDVDHTVEFDGWVSATKALEGDTLAEKMKNHLLSKGISEDTLETIREKFIPGYTRA
ncbi:MAG: tyrosine-protein phosphatase [Bacilli bacterium]|nr:tyrosine-protein phosphatase [Bacilli bacterium]